MGSVVLAIAAVPIEPFIVAWFSFTTVGAVIAWRLPHQPIGWLLLVDGLVEQTADGRFALAGEGD